jgi:2-methylcitrate dehydratase PrpD
MAHYLAGWHATSTLGTMGATAAIARLAGLSAAETANALGIASSLSSGLRVNFGTMTKPLHAGLAAKNGIFATLLAQRGFTAAEDGIGARFGFLDVFRGKEEPRPEELDPAQFGRPWEITLPYGLAIKQFPSCGATHPAIEAALVLRDQHGLSAADIRSIRVGTGKLSSRILIYSEPRTGLEGKFSMEYCVSAALRHGRIGLEHFDDAAVDDPSVRRLMRLTEVYENDEVADSTEFAVVIEVELTDGQKYSHRVDLAKGKVVRPMSERELHTKFRDCATRAMTTQRVEALLSVLVGLRAVPDVRQITQLLEA